MKMDQCRHLTTAPALLNEASRGKGQYRKTIFKHCASDLTIYSTWPEHVSQSSVSEDTKQTVMLSYEDENATRSKDQTGSVRKRPYTSRVHEMTWVRTESYLQGLKINTMTYEMHMYT